MQIISLAVPSIALALFCAAKPVSVSEYTKQDAAVRCERAMYAHEREQLKAYNSFMRHEEGCFLPAAGRYPNLSCLDKASSEKAYQYCVQGRVTPSEAAKLYQKRKPLKRTFVLRYQDGI